MDLKDKLKGNEIILSLLKSETLRKQLTEVIDKKKENDMFTLLNNYYGGKVTRTSDETVLKDHILQSEEFKKFIVELINLIEK